MIMETSQKGINLIKKFEGFRNKAYRCSAGVLTIGYGHTGNVKEGDDISEAKAEELLKEDVKFAENAVNRFVCRPIQQNQFDALVSFVYNLGAGAFSSSTLCRKVNVKPDDDSIYNEFLKWKNIRNPQTGRLQPSAGLLRRREEEAKLYFSKV